MNEVVFNYHLIIIDATHSRVMLKSEGRSSSLPFLQIKGPYQESWWREVGRLNQAVKDSFGLTVITLQALEIDNIKIADRPSGTFILENCSPPSISPNQGNWFQLSEIAGLNFTDTAQISLIKQAFTSITEPYLTQTRQFLAWQMPGWFERVQSWIHTQLFSGEEQSPNKESYFQSYALEQMRNWFLSCILRQPTSRGMLYFKAVPHYFAYEPALTQYVAKEQPNLAPYVLQIETTQGWLLMEGFEGKRLDQAVGNSKYVQYWENLLTNFALLQIKSANCVNYLLEIGLPDWRPELLVIQLETIMPTIKELLDEDDYLALNNHLKLLELACSSLARSGLPPTLHHGDLHSGNILANQDDYRLLDWAGFCAISHPFLSMTVPFLEELITLANRHQLKEAYLAPWEKYLPIKDLNILFEQALPLGIVCGILGHAKELSQATRPWEKAQEQSNLIYYLKLLVKLNLQ